MWQVNTEKCLKLFDKVFVSSDDIELLHEAWSLGAIPIERGPELCGDTPNIPVYQHALERMGSADAIVAVQVCSPTIAPDIIEAAKTLMQMGVHEVMTCHPIERSENYHDQNAKIYGSVWGISAELLKNYPDPLKPSPVVLLVDESVDIHTEEDFLEALRQASV
jgi:CMP-N-acetylneuraminic acid synthetase